MATATSPAPQHMKALKNANAARIAGARLKRDLKAGRISLDQALSDSRAGCLTVMDLLMAQHRWGRERSRRVLEPNYIPEIKRVSTLTDRQRELLAGACR